MRLQSGLGAAPLISPILQNAASFGVLPVSPNHQAHAYASASGANCNTNETIVPSLRVRNVPSESSTYQNGNNTCVLGFCALFEELTSA